MAPPVRTPPGLLGYFLRHGQVMALEHFLAISDGAHPREVAILQLLESFGPASQQWLADYLSINRSVMVKLIDQMEEAGYVERRRNPSDRRSYALSTMPAGQQRLALLGGYCRICQSEVASRLGKARSGRLNLLLSRLLFPRLDREPPGELGDLTGFLVAHTFFRLSALGDVLLRPVGLDTRTFVALVVLAERPPGSQQDLAGWLRIGAAATVELVDELEAKGWVRRARSRMDRRSYALEVTEEGRELAERARRIVMAGSADFMSPIADTEGEELVGLLAELIGEPELLAPTSK